MGESSESEGLGLRHRSQREENLSSVASRLLVIGLGAGAVSFADDIGLVEAAMPHGVFLSVEPLAAFEPSGAPASAAEWILSSDGLPDVEHDVLERHVAAVVDAIEPCAPAVRRIIGELGAQLFLDCYCSADNAPAGPLLQPATLARIVSLGATLSFDFFMTLPEDG